jgi:hypothetical protein
LPSIKNSSNQQGRLKWPIGEQRVEILRRRSFDSEEQLVRAIVACTKRARRHEYRTELEVDAGVGIADLVLTKRAARSTEALKALGSVSPRLAVLLSPAIGDSIKSGISLATNLGTSHAAARRVIAQLAVAGVAKKSGDALELFTVKTPPFERLIAVEAKLSDWQRVLIQAYRNLQFADESWVVLDHAFIRPAMAQLERFKVAGVGLASIDSEQGLFVHHAAASQGPVSLGKRWQAQAVLASRVLKASRTVSSAF